MIHRIFPLIFFFVISLHAADDAGINAKVVAFCESNLNAKVGDGECAVLAEQALRSAGACGHRTDNPGQGDYVWGREYLVLERVPEGVKITGRFEDIRPGDIIQYRDAVFRGFKRFGAYTTSTPHHTTIVYKVAANGHDLTILEQNLNGRKTVGTATLRPDDLKGGWVRFYRPLPAETK